MSAITETERQNLIDKVQNLLAKADSTEFLAEAEAFRAKATELMAKFAITNSEFAGTAEYYIRDVETIGDSPEAWETTLVNAIARFNGLLCVIYTSGTYSGKTQKLKLTGTHGDHSAFNYMYDSVIRQMGSAMFTYINDSGKTNTKARTEFMVGFAYGLQSKVTRLMSDRNNKIQEYGLVPINEVQKARNWYTQNQGQLRTTSSKRLKYENEGYNAGGKASLNKGVTQNSNRLAITG